MMERYQIFSYFFTNASRIFLGLYLVITLLKLSGNMRKCGAISVGVAVFITALFGLSIPQDYLMGIEIIILVLITHCLFRIKSKMCLFLIFFYEIAVSLWDFIVSAGLGVLFHSERFLNTETPEYMAAVWTVRLLMSGVVFLAVKIQASKSKQSLRIISVAAIAGLLGVILLYGQRTIPFSDDQMIPWLIYSMLIPIAILFFTFNRQYKMEKKIVQLETEKNAQLERDYQMLRNNYAANAKLFHDLHNHVDILHHYLSKGNIAEAIKYLENLRLPIQAIAQTFWTGDQALDYLINSKITLATSRHIQVKTNIEFPRNTNIRSVDLVAILGNLLDNSLEAVENAEDSLRFISLTIRRINDMLVIKVENGCNVTSASANGDLQTSKTDKTLHGWGLNSVRTAAERYDGTIETEYSGHTFCAVVTLFFEAVNVSGRHYSCL